MTWHILPQISNRSSQRLISYGNMIIINAKNIGANGNLYQEIRAYFRLGKDHGQSSPKPSLTSYDRTSVSILVISISAACH